MYNSEEIKKTHRFVTKVISNGRITLDANIRKNLRIKDGDYVFVELAKIKV